MEILKVKGLKKVFNGVVALEGINFTLSKGEVLGILGPNGAGKTTLINCILGLIEPTEGSIELFGLDIRFHRSRVLKRVNFASNYVSLPYSLTPFENLMVFANLYEIKNPERRCKELLELFGLEPYSRKPTRRLSSGQLMRLNLAKALINRPELLLLDEPTTGLDPEIARKTRRLLLEMAATAGISVIYTSHNLKEMEEVSKRLLFLSKGNLVADGMISELIKGYSVKDLEEFYFKVIGDEG
ncbi:MAG: ABC transporter ATP-binding protein [Nitrospirae bacterium]|nr:MAG: ABC transporter ATP-binding protein [Nitrospirota bacterium]